MWKIGMALALLVGAWTTGAVVATTDEEVAVLDDCDPTDPGWAPTGGCALADGDVTVKEFFALLPPGHPAWRNEPSYLKIEPTESVKVTNEGGRHHTFTEVAAFGGGFISALNKPLGLTPAPECGSGGTPKSRPRFSACGYQLGGDQIGRRQSPLCETARSLP